MTCPPPDRLLAFASGELGDDQSASIEAHIDACAECRAALSSAARGDVPPRFGRYRVDTVLGSGGMGIVYRAWDPQLARAVAIKVVKRAGEDTVGRARLVREAQSLARLSHPNVCHVYDVGTDGDEVWVAMELIDGVSLREWAVGRDPDALLGVLLGAAEGIAAAHGAGMIHRDVKPENVLVTRDGRAIVTDFGLARGGDRFDPNASTLSSDDKLTVTGAIAGTPAYLAPEQLTGDPLDDRVDQFAWAVMAWELLAGSRPFPIVFALRVDAVRAGLTAPAAMDKRVAEILTRALQVAPRDRFGSMRELIAALRATERRRARRTPARLVALGALVLGGGAATLWIARPPKATNAVAAVSPKPTPTPQLQPQPNPQLQPTPQPQPQPQPQLQPNPQLQPSPQLQPQPEPNLQPQPNPQLQPNPNPRPIRTRSTSTAAAAKPVAPAPTTPAATVEQIAAQPDAATATALAASRPLRREAAYASMLAFCRIPYDPVHLEPSWGRSAIVDWGKVTSVRVERGAFDGDPVTQPIVTIAGHRGRYRIEAQILSMGSLQVAAGDTVALCYDREPSDLYRYPGGPVLPVITALPVHGEPQVAELAKHRALFVRDIELAAQGASGHVTLAADRQYVVRTTSKGRDGATFEMDRWFLDVPPGLPGTDQIAGGQPVWIIVERPELLSAPTGGTPRLTLHAVEVLPEVLP